jgi:hypothetical protein
MRIGWNLAIGGDFTGTHLKGIKQSEQHIANKSKALIGRNSGFKGKKHTQSAIEKTMQFVRGIPKTNESKLKNRLAHNKSVVINGVTYESGKKASEILNLPNTTISAWLNGRGSFLKSKYNWIFEYYRPLEVM